jgi:polysaccharide biosynthesis protein PelD
VLASGSRYIACAPLISASGETRALLVVERMPFLSLNHDNLQLLFVLLGYYGDGLEYARATHELIDAVPGCPSDFGLEYGRLVQLHQRSGIESSVVALSFPRDEEHDSLFEHVLRRGRSADLAWPLQTSKRSVLLNLMPLADATGVAGYLARIETNLRNQFDTDFERARIGVHTLHVTGASGKTSLAELLQRVTNHE